MAPASRRSRRQMLGEVRIAPDAEPLALGFAPSAPRATRPPDEVARATRSVRATNLRKPRCTGGGGHAVHV